MKNNIKRYHAVSSGDSFELKEFPDVGHWVWFEDHQKELAESNERLKLIHAILSGGGVLGYRVDKAIRKIEKWQGITDDLAR